jgi:hypothetical protein
MKLNNTPRERKIVIKTKKLYPQSPSRCCGKALSLLVLSSLGAVCLDNLCVDEGSHQGVRVRVRVSVRG